MADGINYTGDFPRYVLDHIFDNLTNKSYSNIDDRNNVEMLRIITHETKSKFKLIIGVVRKKFWINTVVMIQYVRHCLCWLFYFQNIMTGTFLFEKLSCAVEILIWSDAVNFLTKPLGMPYSVVTAQQVCSTETITVQGCDHWILPSQTFWNKNWHMEQANINTQEFVLE